MSLHAGREQVPAARQVAIFDAHPETARSLGEQSLTLAEQVGDPALTAWALHLLGLAAYIPGDNSGARIHYKRSLAIRPETPVAGWGGERCDLNYVADVYSVAAAARARASPESGRRMPAR